MSEETAMSSTSGGRNDKNKRTGKHYPQPKPSLDSPDAMPSESHKTLNGNVSKFQNERNQNSSKPFLPYYKGPKKNRKSFQSSSNNTKSDLSHALQFNSPGKENHRREKPKLDKSKIKFSYKKLEELCKLGNALRIAIELANTFNGLEHLLNELDFLKENPDWIILLTEVFAKMCKCEFQENKVKVLNVIFESQFIELILDCLSKMSIDSDKERLESFLDNVFILIDTLVNSFPNASKDKLHGPVKQVFGNISCIQELAGFHIDDSIKTNFTKLESRLRDMQSAYASMLDNGKKHLDSGEPPENYRTFELYPCEEEVLFKKKVFLRRNIVDGKYESVEHYLDVQFRLLREDLLIPLREGIGELVSKLSSQEYKKIKVNYLRYFDRCRIQRISTEHGTVSYDVCFDVDRKLNHINWEYNQWFKHGSLILLSYDNFASFISGKVTSKNNKLCQNYRIISVELIGDKEIELEEFDRDAMMVESTVFFEPYYQVMKALKRFHDRNFPLVRYIIDVNPSIQPPAYLQENRFMQIGGNIINVLDDHSWPSAEKLNLNQYQFEAFKTALTQEFAIMQGPPGTGKTYVGLKIVETLVKFGRDAFFPLEKSPILVVCYTNHALDQFLEGILKFTQSVIRVGSRTKSEIIKEYELSSQKRREDVVSRDNMLKGAFLTLRNETKDIIEQIRKMEHHLKEIDYEVGIVFFNHLAPHMSKSHQKQLGSDEKLVQWLLMKDDLKLEDLVSEKRYCPKRHTTLENDNEVIDDDEFREEIRNDNIIADIIKTFATYEINVHALHIGLLEAETKELVYRCETLEQECDIKSDEYARKRWIYESRLTNIRFVIGLIAEQYNKLHFTFLAENLTTVSTKLAGLDIDSRWELYSQWVSNLRCTLMSSMKALEKRVRMKSEQLDEAKQLEDLNVLKQVKIVGITTTIAAKKHLLLTELKPRIVVVEEAAEVLEAHIVTALTEHCQHLILIGDHQQLRPNPTVYKLAKQYQLDVSLFERMINNKLNFSRLGIQHRMRPEICELITPAIYPKLENHLSVYDFENVKGISKNLFFLTHEIDEVKDNSMQSFKNTHEGDFVLQFAQYLLLQEYSAEEITILTTYSGQLIYLNMEKKNMPQLQDVRISTVDNYQGEECEIILLSLVRSNTEDKIGFLKISNRVCVALSRARKGLYITGNMKILAENSDIWKPIKNKLEEHQSIGPQLELQCVMHGNKTLVKEKKDFASVAEGGCSIVCDSPLSCGHNCVRLCHSYDLNHEKYLCRERCTQSCAEGHPCVYLCFQCADTCQNCLVQIDKFQLKCGHIKDIQCFQIQKYECKENVEVDIELCGHKVLVTCHAVTSNQIKCPKTCDIRLPCGHQCTRTCHKDDDPDHLDFKCMKKCERLKKGCSQKHKCPGPCSEPCPVCNENVLKKLECGHEQEALCHLEVMECLQACSRTLECGHPCRRRCKETCGDCRYAVDKMIPECGHIVSMKCKTAPNRLLCQQACEKQLTCGHLCPKKCKEPCISTDKCSVLVVHPTVVSLCAHGNVLVPCKDKDLSKELLQDEGLKHCNRPCGETLLCGHTCKGTCSQCQQNRFHKVCNEKCNRVFLCGHKCRLDCSSICPPCESRCLTKCPHKACKRSCSEKCDPCFEDCEWRCDHQKCRLPCPETCNRRRCYQQCENKLKCEHKCIGFCGEPCPKKCRICDEDEVNAALLGSVMNNDKARFVVLEDCGHFFESYGLEQYLGVPTSASQTRNTEISMKTCPKCETPIVSTLRFMNTIKFIRRNIGPANILLNNLIPEKPISNQKLDLILRLSKLQKSTHLSAGSQYSSNIVSNISKQLESPSSNVKRYQKGKIKTFISVDQLRLFTCLVEIVECLETGFFELYKRGLGEEIKKLLLRELDKILCSAMNIPNNKVNEQIKLDFFCEIDRFYALVNLLSLRLNYADSLDFDEETDGTALNKICSEYLEQILRSTRFTQERSDHIHELLEIYQTLIMSKVPPGIFIDKVTLKRPDSPYWQNLQKVKLRVFRCSLNQHLFCLPVDEEDTSCPECKKMRGSNKSPRTNEYQAQPHHPIHDQVAKNTTETERSYPGFSNTTHGNLPFNTRPSPSPSYVSPYTRQPNPNHGRGGSGNRGGHRGRGGEGHRGRGGEGHRGRGGEDHRGRGGEGHRGRRRGGGRPRR